MMNVLTLAISAVACAISVAVLVWQIRLDRRDDARQRERWQDRETELWEAEKRATRGGYVSPRRPVTDLPVVPGGPAPGAGVASEEPT